MRRLTVIGSAARSITGFRRRAQDFSFRFGNTKFTLTNVGKAEIKNVVTDPATGSTYLDTAQATLQT